MVRLSNALFLVEVKDESRKEARRGEGRRRRYSSRRLISR